MSFEVSHETQTEILRQAQKEGVSVDVLLQRLVRAHCAGSSAAPQSMIGALEQEWLRQHWREHLGNWVALDCGRLVAEAPGAREALERARAAGFATPFLAHVTAPSELPFGGW